MLLKLQVHVYSLYMTVLWWMLLSQGYVFQAWIRLFMNNWVLKLKWM